MSDVRVSVLIATGQCVTTFQELFVCQHCGRCCTEFKGLKLSEEEIERLGVPRDEWPSRFRVIDGGYILEQPCQFYSTEGHACLVYDNRPTGVPQFPRAHHTV